MALSRVLPTVSGNLSLPQLNYTSLIAAGAIIPEFIERGMDCDFSFDIGGARYADNYKSRVSPFELVRTGKNVELQDNIAGKYIILNAGQNGLVGPTPDQRELTQAALYIYRVPAASGDTQLIFGNQLDGENTGETVNLSSTGSITMQVRGYATQGSVTQENLIAQGLNLSNTNVFLFVALTSRITSGDATEHTLFVGAPTPQIITRSGTKNISPRRVGFGNVYRTDAPAMAMPGRFGRYMSGPGSRTVEQLAGMYARAKIVAARRGMTVL